MVLKFEQCKVQDDIEITIKYPLNKDKTVKHIASLINSIDIQINKYCILNFRMLVRINPLANSHLEAVLKNDNRLFVTRKHLAEIKQKLRELL